jgi:hypothetical protein
MFYVIATTGLYKRDGKTKAKTLGLIKEMVEETQDYDRVSGYYNFDSKQRPKETPSKKRCHVSIRDSL